MNPQFSICHTTGRPKGWQASCAAWLKKANSPEQVEYILAVDRRWGFTELPHKPPFKMGSWRAVWNEGRQCMVDGYDAAVQGSTGAVIILNSDDMFPPPAWDDALLEVIEDHLDELSERDWNFVIQVSSGTAADERDLMVLQILSRLRYKRLGYALYPLYEGVFADDDFSEHARHDKVVIDARHLTFEHRHPGQEEYDDVYWHQNDPRQYQKGVEILARRMRDDFRR